MPLRNSCVSAQYCAAAAIMQPRIGNTSGGGDQVWKLVTPPFVSRAAVVSRRQPAKAEALVGVEPTVADLQSAPQKSEDVNRQQVVATAIDGLATGLAIATKTESKASPDLDAVASAWPNLPRSIQLAILALAQVGSRNQIDGEAGSSDHRE
jgi:hypothetical protein